MTALPSTRPLSTGFYKLNLGLADADGVLTPEQIHDAALTVCDHANSADEARDLLQRLGLLTELTAAARP